MEQEKNTKIFQILIAVVLIILIGTLGYYLIEKDWSLFEAFYMTVITISTVGYGETRELSVYGRIFTVFIIFFGIGIVALSAGQLASFVINREIKSLLGREKFQKQLKKLKNHYIIFGFNNISYGICCDFIKRKIPFIILAGENSSLLENEKELLYMIGDVSDEANLLKTGLERAKGLIICDNSNVNSLHIALAAKEINQEARIIAIGSDPKTENRMIRSGIDCVVYPLKLGGEQIAKAILEHSGKDVTKLNSCADNVLGFSLEYFVNFEDKTYKISEIAEKYSAVSVLTLFKKGDVVIECPSSDLEVNKNESLILVSAKQKRSEDKVNKKSILKWDSTMSVGVISLDKEHQHLVDLLNKIENDLQNNESRRVIDSVFDEMFEYVLTHFRHEEFLFENFGYPGLDEHKKIHEDLLSQVNDLDSKRAVIKTESLVEFLRSWIKHHIMEDDKKYSEFLVAKGAK